MTTTHVLTYDFADLLGVALDPTHTKAWIETNAPHNVIVDTTTGGKVLAGAVRLGDKTTVTGTVALPTTSGATIPTNFQYRVWIEYRTIFGGKVDTDRWNSGWFSLTADVNLKDVVEEQYVPPTYITQATQTLDEHAAALQAPMDAAVTEAEAARDDAVDISNISTSDDVVEALVKNTAGAGPKTSAALNTAFAPVFTAEAEGTVGSGDDTALLQAALTKARAAQGVLRLAPGRTYIVSGALNPAGARVEGRGATLKIKDGTTPAYTVLTPTAGCVIEDVTVDLNKAATTDPGNQLHGGGFLMNQASWDGLVVRNVKIKNGHQIGVHIYGPGAQNADLVTYCRTVLDNVTVEACKVANYSIKTVRGVTMRDCRSLNAVATSIYLSVVGQSHVLGCQSIGGGGSGIFLEYCQDVTVANGLYANNASQGIAVGGGSDTLRENRNVTVIGNVVRNNGSIGITVDPTKAAALQSWVAVYSTVANNLCEGNGGTGINLENAAHVSVIGNVCHANGGTGLRILGAYVNASGNVLTQNTSYGLAVYGVVGKDNGHHSFGGNTVIGNTAGQYDVAAISSGVVTDVVTQFPGIFKATGTVHAAPNTAGEAVIGPLGPSSEAGLRLWDSTLYRAAAKVLAVPTDHTFRTGRAVTASRPSATTAGAGAVFYDTTLSKPIWSDGAVWRDSAGTAV